MIPVGAAILGSAAIGGLTSLYGAKAAKRQSNKQAQLAMEQLDLQRQQLEQAQAQFEKQFDFAQEQFNWYRNIQEEDRQRWMSIYGPIEESLASFYQALTPEQFSMPALSQVRQSLADIDQELQARVNQGRLTEGAAAQLGLQAKLAGAEQMAGIQQAAPMQVAAAQQSFLRPLQPMGANPYAGMVNSALTGSANAFTNMASAAGQNAAMFGNLAAASSQAALQGWQGFGQSVAGGLSSYIGWKQQQSMLDALRLQG